MCPSQDPLLADGHSGAQTGTHLRPPERDPLHRDTPQQCSAAIGRKHFVQAS